MLRSPGPSTRVKGHIQMRGVRHRPVRSLCLAAIVGAAVSLYPAGASAYRRAGPVVTEYPNPVSRPEGITPGPDGAMWSTSPGTNPIGRISASGKVTTYAAPGIDEPEGITAGPDGALWFTNYGNNS